MAVFATGPGTPQTTLVTNSATQVFSTTQTGLSGTLKNLLVLNSGPVTVYIGAGTGSTATASAGVALIAGAQMLISGTAENVYAITSSGTSTVVAGVATLATAD